jgi:hypothetical protein
VRTAHERDPGRLGGFRAWAAAMKVSMRESSGCQCGF